MNNPLQNLGDMSPYQRNRLILGTLAGLLVVVVLFGIFGVFGGEEEQEIAPERVTLTLWDPFGNEDIYREAINAYRDENPNVTINVEQMRFDTYRRSLTEALAADEGPDIFAIHNTWLPIQGARISPLNENLNVNAATIVNLYPDVVRFDFTRETEDGVPTIYALPLYLDSLALYYNREHFNSANLLSPPETWEEFVEYVKVLRRIEGGQVVRAGAALGGAENVNRASDILALLMLQTGAQMNNEFGRVAFDLPIGTGDDAFFPGRDALSFYTSFARPESEHFTWNPSGTHSVDAFSLGEASMMINYSHQREVVRDKNSALDFDIAPLPQPVGRIDQVNYANYWGLTVSKDAANAAAAWDFIRFMTTDANNATLYLEAADRPPALRSLVGEYMEHEELGVFASQALTAKSWLQPDADQVDAIMQEAIEVVLNGGELREAIDEASRKINIIETPEF